MQELPILHTNYSSGAIIWESVHPIEENIMLLNNTGMYNYTAVDKNKHILINSFVRTRNPLYLGRKTEEWFCLSNIIRYGGWKLHCLDNHIEAQSCQASYIKDIASLYFKKWKGTVW